MAKKEVITSSAVQGRIQAWNFHADGCRELRVEKRNQIQVDWAAVITKLLSGDLRYKISGMYVEYENVDNPGDTVDVAEFSVYEGVEYYEDLADSVNRDYLRIPLHHSPTLAINNNGEADYFVEGETANSIQYMTVTSGSVGVHGKTFSAAALSRVFGLALVAMPDSGDTTKDLIFARGYFAGEQQVDKLASGQLAFTWDLTFRAPTQII